SGGQYIIVNQNIFSFLNCIRMNFQIIGSVFQFICGRNRIERKLSFLANRHKTCSQFLRQQNSKEKTSTLHTDNSVNFNLREVSFDLFQNLSSSLRAVE